MTSTEAGRSGMEELAGVRPNWRAIPVVELTEAEVALMTDDEARWCNDLLHERYLKLTAPSAEPGPVVAPTPESVDIDAGGIAVMATGDRILIYPGESDRADAFAGEKLNPNEGELRSNSYVSCLWDRAKVVRVELAHLQNQGNPSTGKGVES